jgi:hypothetical protein
MQVVVVVVASWIEILDDAMIWLVTVLSLTGKLCAVCKVDVDGVVVVEVHAML